MTTGKDQTTPEREPERKPEQQTAPEQPKSDEPKPVEDTPSSHETSGQFPADEVAATYEQGQPKT
jgi:hypothetical protein